MGTVRYTVIDREVIAEKRSGVRKQYVPDPLGSTVAMLDNTQTQTDTFSYWPYGELASRTGSTPTPFQYVGTEGYYSNSIDRVYVRARILSTQLGRWLTEDPMNFRLSNFNLYLYSYLRPSCLTDPSGKEPDTNFNACGNYGDSPPVPPPVPSVPRRNYCDDNVGDFCIPTETPNAPGVVKGSVGVSQFCHCYGGIGGQIGEPMQKYSNSGWACSTSRNGCCQYITEDIYCYSLPPYIKHRIETGNHWYHWGTIYHFEDRYKGKCQANGKCSGNNSSLPPSPVQRLGPPVPR